MIVAVKRNKKQKFYRYLSLVFVFVMFIGYYFYMSSQQQEKQRLEAEKKKAIQLKKENDNIIKKKLEKTLLFEIEKAVDLIGQKNVRNVKIIENKVLIVCEPNTNLEALMVRYGAMALTKKNVNEIIIAIDINYILKSKLNDD